MAFKSVKPGTLFMAFLGTLGGTGLGFYIKHLYEKDKKVETEERIQRELERLRAQDRQLQQQQEHTGTHTAHNDNNNNDDDNSRNS